ncbi:Leucine--tRNA ligase [Buchnera aphidicola (Cinara kochiana kochiana)]|uniref:Leucine--tRNA ligase n=1 Tax=Buchnera aphidicola (Cinara kochiana kochiana) TaxID=2518976 RepID=A0A451D5U1_9GAMM|nr:leucine--tRNA ligase [Buchnera aphidicola]VFP81188.1 Leucine--tRNA ligase [Buchnera aphidicola (Cinara kochiana kochiana)]
MEDISYNPKKIESVVQKHWIKNKTFSVIEDKTKKKFYCLPMIPYPSGKLHMGHVRNYTISDVISRYQRMLGKNVLQPIGWDAFGLPAEETAIKKGISPHKWTLKNISIMKKQLQSLGFSYDWSREITTCQPKYYRWEQSFFIKLFKKNLVYKKKTVVNWCSVDNTVLANEQAQNGQCWRCGSKITFKKISQWFIKITAYAEELLQDLKLLNQWPKEVITMQKNWIGKSEGIKIKCKIEDKNYFLNIYTTKPETIMGITFFAISIHHPLISTIIKNNSQINQFLKKNIDLFNTDFKNSNNLFGINTNLLVSHPITHKKIPLWITNYVRHDYATGAIMAVPGHNKIDYSFAKIYNIPIKLIFSNINNKNIEKKIILINSSKFNNLSIKQARKKITKTLIKKKIAKLYKYYKIKDWCISRQRYWGTPIPMIINHKNNILPVPETELPVILPKYIHQDKYTQSLKSYNKWLKTKIYGEKVTRESDTFDTFMESSWYYARYTNTNFDTDILDTKSTKYWLPVDQYIGGIEHAVMHLIYFRFYHKLLRDFGYVNSPEPVKKLTCQGMVIIDSFYIQNDDGSKKWLSPSKLDIDRNKNGKIIKISKKNCLHKIIYAGKIKMSKSKNNGIDPHLIVNQYGADTLRLFLMFAAPIHKSLEWNSSSIIGMHRFLKKIWTFVYTNKIKNIKNSSNDILYNQKNIKYKLNDTIIHVTNNIKNDNSFNTAIAHIMKFFNYIEDMYNKNKINYKNLKKSLESIIKMLYPFTPHICFILWKKINGKKYCIDTEKWPSINNNLTIKKTSIVVVQIHGKKRNIINIKNNLSKQDVINIIITKKEIKKHFYNKTIKKVIYIPNKVINFILETNKK